MNSLSRVMYEKYSESQDYYFSRDINDILTGALTPPVIHWEDTETLLEEDEYLKREYR